MGYADVSRVPGQRAGHAPGRRVSFITVLHRVNGKFCKTIS